MTLPLPAATSRGLSSAELSEVGADRSPSAPGRADTPFSTFSPRKPVGNPRGAARRGSGVRVAEKGRADQGPGGSRRCPRGGRVPPGCRSRQRPHGHYRGRPEPSPHPTRGHPDLEGGVRTLQNRVPVPLPPPISPVFSFLFPFYYYYFFKF